MKTYMLPFALLVIVLIGIGFFIASMSTSRQQLAKQVQDEVNRLGTLPHTNATYDHMTPEDFSHLEELTKKDPFAYDFVEEAKSLAEYHQPEHIAHEFFFLDQYLTTGDKNICVPHELLHIAIYLENNRTDLAEEKIPFAERYRDDWIAWAQQTQQKYPQYYKHFDELVSHVDQALGRLDEHQYDNETLTLIDRVEEEAIC